LIEKPQLVQLKQAQEILDFVADKDEVILAGDLNITPFSEAYKLLATVFQDCSTHLASTFPRKAQTLDYVFYKGDRYSLSHLTFLRYEDAPIRVSDHFGLVVELTNKAKCSSLKQTVVDSVDWGLHLSDTLKTNF
jgi:endonuclease/exonuclease/phosphatase (EEP) superfamily protein YafD